MIESEPVPGFPASPCRRECKVRRSGRVTRAFSDLDDRVPPSHERVIKLYLGEDRKLRCLVAQWQTDISHLAPRGASLLPGGSGGDYLFARE